MLTQTASTFLKNQLLHLSPLDSFIFYAAETPAVTAI